MSNLEPFRILCLSGGGFRGLFTASFLTFLEREIGITDFRKHFQLIVGTSTGALLASGLACGVPPSALTLSFLDQGPHIFRRRSSFLHAARMALGLGKYPHAPLIKAIQEAIPEFWNKPIESLDAPLAIVSLSRVTQKHRLFTAKPYTSTTTRTPLFLSILASAAAPTYFAEVQLDDDRLVDGGLVANAPVLLSAALALRHKRLVPQQSRILHIGTAGQPAPENVRAPDGLVGRLKGLTGDLVTLTLAAQEKLAIDVASTWLPEQYLYVDVPQNLNFHPSLCELDDASEESVGQLQRCADEAWRHWKDHDAFRSFFPAPRPIFSERAAP